MLMATLAALHVRGTAGFWSARRAAGNADAKKDATDAGSGTCAAGANCGGLTLVAYENGVSDEDEGRKVVLSQGDCAAVAAAAAAAAAAGEQPDGAAPTRTDLAALVCKQASGPPGCRLHNDQGVVIDACEVPADDPPSKCCPAPTELCPPFG